VVASLGTTAVDFLVRVMFLVLVYAYYGLHPSAAALAAIPALLPLLVLTVALALIQSLLGVVVRDVANLIPTLLSLLVFLMPVYYETPRNATFARLNNWNPLYHLVCGPRDLLVRGHLAAPFAFSISAAGALVLLVLAARLFAGAQYKLAERA
jgi:lipopolysaccharide transport system permease protein